MEKNLFQLTLSSCLIHKERKTRKNFLSTIHQLIDWSKVEAYLKTFYSKGKSTEGRKSYPPLVLFKMLLLEQWYGLSDYEVEEQCKDSISFSTFIGIPLEERVPKHILLYS